MRVSFLPVSIRVFIFLIICTYLPGLIFSGIFTEKFNSYYTFDGNIHYVFLIVVLLFSLFFSMIYFFSKKIPQFNVKKLPTSLWKVIFALSALLFFSCSLYFFIKFSVSFRHKNRLSEAGIVVILMFFLRYIALYYLYICIIELMKGKQLSKYAVNVLKIFALGWLLSINGSFQVIYLFLVFLVLFSPTVFCQKSSISFSRIILMPMMGVCLLFSILAIGIGNKVGFEFLLSPEGQAFLLNYISTIAARTSTSLFSLGALYELYLFDLANSFDIISMQLKTFINRLSIFLPFIDFDSDGIYTVNRFNYLVSFENHADRAGATPGFFGTVILSGGFPIGFIMMSLYLALVMRMWDNRLKNIKKVSLISIMALAYFMLPFIESPLGILNLFEPSTFYLLFFILTHLFLNPSILLALSNKK